MLPDDYKEPQNSGKSAGGVANLTPFPKGVSGNPSGRPKGLRNRSTIIREHLEAKLRGEDGKEHEVVDALVIAQVAKAMTGDTPAFRELMDSGYGKNPDTQNLQHLDAEGKPTAPPADLSKLSATTLKELQQLHANTKPD